MSAPVYDGTTYTPSVLDDVLFLPDQDPHEPIEESDGDIADMQNVDDPNDQYAQAPLEVRTAYGVLDFFNEIIEETDEFLSADKPVQVKGPKLDAIRTRELGSDTWRARTQTVNTAPVQIVVKSKTRRSVTIVNTGAGVAYISALTQQGTGAPNQFPIPVSNPAVAGQWYPITLETKDDIWCVSPTTCVLSLIEEFDQEE